MVFDFQAPLMFQKKRVGMVQLGLSQPPLIAAADLTFYTMLGLLVAVVMTVVIVAYLLATGITVPMRILRRAIAHVHHGNLGYRIDKARNDELGLLFAEYNRMADTLLKQREEHQHQVQQGVPQIVEENDNNLNDEPEQAGPESSEQASHKQVPPEKVKSEEKPAEEDDEALAAAAAEYDDATRIMPPKKNNK
jgi:serine/threonine-protein kinase